MNTVISLDKSFSQDNLELSCADPGIFVGGGGGGGRGGPGQSDKIKL